MAPPSLFRRTLPWIFAIGFIIVAPIVVFRTSGYRWNTKKGVVERNSTLIVDSIPDEADVLIDSQKTGEKTPVTIQSVSPGVHQITIAKPGYHPWQKSLDVRPERVTFANTITLWKDTDPVLRYPEPTTHISVSPDERTLFRLATGTSTFGYITDFSTLQTERILFPRRMMTDDVRIQWSPSSRFIFIESTDATRWLIDTQSPQDPLELPVGRYRWENDQLIGNDGANLLVIRLPQMTITKTPHDPDVYDRSVIAEIRTTTGTNHLIYVRADQPDRGLILPSGDWKLFGQIRNIVLLNQDNEWLALQDRLSTPIFHRVVGDFLRPFRPSSIFQIATGDDERFLIVNSGEVWLWDLMQEPELLLRQSGPIVNALWHDTGNDIFIATAKTIFALNLDVRDGYLMTPLMDFDRITDISRFRSNLLIAGTKNGQTGVWELEIE
jgi:PEGA domain-containing protein